MRTKLTSTRHFAVACAFVAASFAVQGTKADSSYSEQSTPRHVLNDKGVSYFKRAIRHGKRRIGFDVAEDATRFVYADAPVDDNIPPLPLYGNPFVTKGYIYPLGTLKADASGHFNGVIIVTDPKTGEQVVKPEFPDKVLGRWYCYGRMINEKSLTEATGPIVLSTQMYDFNKVSGQDGSISLMSTGIELADFGSTVSRVVTGGTGSYRRANGEIRQTFLGHNVTEGFSLRFHLNAQTNAQKRPRKPDNS